MRNITITESFTGYQYNPVEIGARYFGESMVRELTKGIINNA